jgi:hypothetical protein
MSEILLHKNFPEEQIQESSVVRRRDTKQSTSIHLKTFQNSV